ncbi:hypothetical protein LZ30DRAFT_818471 [Colletotrichum cereale]|nr:hypothetical protein LZ30DRAFT_818471 [Colletotrichum cereale]
MAPRLDKMILDALEEVANKTRKPIDEVLRATQAIIENNIVKDEPAAVNEAPAQAEPVAAIAKTATKTATKTVTNTDVPKAAPKAAPKAPAAAPAAAETSASTKKRAAPKLLGSGAKRAAAKVKAPASDSDTVPDDPADDSGNDRNANRFPCGFSNCSRNFLHKSSRNRHYKINHNGQTP